MTEPEFDKAIKIAFALYESAGHELVALPLPVQTVVTLVHVQGIIDNGGLQYLFENRLRGDPPYSFLSDAYRRIGADEAADALDSAVARFPFQDPHLHRDKRMDFLDNDDIAFRGLMNDVLAECRREEQRPINRLSKVFFKRESGIWNLLKRYVETHRAAFVSSLPLP